MLMNFKTYQLIIVNLYLLNFHCDFLRFFNDYKIFIKIEIFMSDSYQRFKLGPGKNVKKGQTWVQFEGF